LFDVKDALQYSSRSRGGYGFGSMPYHSKNRQYGAVFSYYLKEVPKTKRAERRKKDKELFKNKEKIDIPSPKELLEEEKELAPYLSFLILDESGNVIRRLNKSASTGINRVAWNLRHASSRLERSSGGKFDPLNVESDAMPVLPGNYTVSLELIATDTVITIGEAKTFAVQKLDNVTLPATDKSEWIAFQKQVDELNSVVRGADRLVNELSEKALLIKQTVHVNPKASKELLVTIDQVLNELDQIKWKFRGEVPKASYEERIPDQVTINDRIGSLVSVHSRSSSEITGTQRMVFGILEEELPPILQQLEKIANKTMPEIEIMLDSIGAPWTPGRVPKWNKK